MKLKAISAIIWCIVLSMALPFTLPVMAYAQSGMPTIGMENRESALSVAPYKDDLGVIVNAEDITSFYGMDYDYNSEDKTFTIHSPKHGEVVLSHNATNFKSGENVFECLPYFFVVNGTPKIEVGFFCEMFDLDFDYDEDEDKITLYHGARENTIVSEISVQDSNEEIHLMSSGVNSTLSGKVKLENSPKHKNGLKVALVLTPVSANRSEWVWESIYMGGHMQDHYVQVTRCDKGTPVKIGEVSFNETEYEKNYTFNVKSDEVNPDGYEYYTVGYEVSNDKYFVLNKYGYIDTKQETSVTYSSPSSGAAGSPDAYKYEYRNNTADISITPKNTPKTVEDYKRNATLIIRDYKKPSYYDVNQFNVLQSGKIYQTDEKGTLYYSGSSPDFTIVVGDYQSFAYPLPMEYLKGAYHSKLYIYKEEDFSSKPKINAIYYNRFNIFGPKGYADSRSYMVGDTLDTCTITPVISTKFDECEVTSMSVEQGKMKKAIEVQTKPSGDYNIYYGSTEEIHPGVEFSKGEPIYLVITTDTGETIKEALNIQALESKPADVDVDMGDSIDMDTPAGEKTLLDGMKLKVDLFKNVPAEFKVTPTGNHNYDIKGTIGFQSKDSDKSYDTVKNGFAAARTAFKDKEYETKNPIKSFDNFFKKLADTGAEEMKDMPTAEFGCPIKLKMYGYVDGTYNLQDSGKYLASFQELGLGAKLSFSKEVTRICVTPSGVPGYWNCALEFEDTLTTVFKEQNGKLQIPDKAENEAEISIKGGIGVGLPDLVSLGASGTGKVKFTCEIPISQDTMQAILSGKINLFDYKLGCIEGSIIKFDTPTCQIYPEFMELESYGEEVFEEEVSLTQLSRSYTDTPLVMNVEQIELFSADGTETPIISETVANNTYTFANAQLAELENGDLLAAWVEDVRTRESDADRTGIYYSIKHEGTWSDPVIVEEDTTADFNPKMKKIGGKIYLTWLNATENFKSDETDIAAIASTLKTSVAVWGGSKFNTLGSIESKGAVSLEIAEINGVPTVVWIEDQSENKTSVKTAKYENGAWKISELLKEQSVIDGLDIAEVNGKAVIYYSQDTDNDSSTIEDKEIFMYADGKTKQITNNDTTDTKPTASQDGVYWYSDSNIAYQPYGSTGISYINANCSSDKFSVSQMNNKKIITYTKTSKDGGTDIWAECFDGEEWGEPIKIVTTDKYILNQQALMMSDNSFNVMTSNTSFEDDGFGTSSIEMYNVSPYVDLEMDGIRYNEYSMKSGTEYSFTVTNKGSETVNGIKVELYNASGSRIGSETFEEAVILPGETLDYTTSFYDYTSGDKKLTVSPINVTDIDMSNNSDTVNLNFDVDLAVENIRDESTKDKIIVGADIINHLNKEVKNINVSLLKGSSMGEVIETKTIDCATDYSNSIYGTPVYFEIENGEPGVYYIVCEEQENEGVLGNNSDFITAVLLSDLDEDIDGAIEFTEEADAVIADFARNTFGGVFGYIAAYDSNNALLAIERVAINKNNVRKTMNKNESAATYKAFLWDSNLRPLCEAKTLTASK